MIYQLVIPGWHPVRLNQLLHVHYHKANRMKKTDRELIGFYAKQAGIPPATGKRRVSLRIVLVPRQRGGDPDAYWKSLLDALVHAGLLLDDNAKGVELGPVSFVRAAKKTTVITLKDLPSSRP
jgi:Holliday junction resolvase RusA-like endonuclease